MNFEYPQKTLDLIEKVDQFIKKYLFPHEQKVYEFSKNNLWENYPEMENWKEMAKEQGFDYVIDATQGGSLILANGKDLMEEVKKELGF